MSLFVNKDGYLRIGMVATSIIVGIVALTLIFGSSEVVPVGYRGIKVTLGNAAEKPLDNGLYFKMPLVQTIVQMNVQTQISTSDASAAAKDLNEASTQVSVNYHIDPLKVVDLYKNIGTDYERTIIAPAIQETVKATTAKFTAEELVTKRDSVKKEITDALAVRLSRSYIIVDEVSITNFNFSAEFNAAIEAKVKAEQDALASKNKLEQVKYEAQQKIETAKADAESIRIQGEALQKNPALVELKRVEKWNGEYPQYYLGGGGVPLINIPVK